MWTALRYSYCQKVPRDCTLPIYVHKIKPSLADSEGTKCCRYLLVPNFIRIEPKNVENA